MRLNLVATLKFLIIITQFLCTKFGRFLYLIEIFVVMTFTKEAMCARSRTRFLCDMLLTTFTYTYEAMGVATMANI